MAKKLYAVNSWIVDDVLELAEQLEIHISKKRAEGLLKQNEKAIMSAMTEAGWRVIETGLYRMQDNARPTN